MTNNYYEIINLPRHISKIRHPMAIKDRAAQFSPFAALAGHDTAVKETARLTENKVELDQYMKEALNHKLQILMERIKENDKIKITYFVPDKNKDGGSYIDTTGIVKKIDGYEKRIFMSGGIVISIDEIICIKGQIFDQEIGPDISES